MTNKEFLTQMKSEYFPLEFPDDREEFPCSGTLPPSLIYRLLPVPINQKPAEFIHFNYDESKRDHEVETFIFEWNIAWETGHLRYQMFQKRIPKQLGWLKDYHDSNLFIIPENKHNYYAHQHLLNLLPARTRQKFNLPYTKRGMWPSEMHRWYLNKIFPQNFKNNLSDAFAYHIWPLLNNMSKLNKFSKNEPLSVLSHNLNFWAPFLNQIIQKKLQEIDRVPFENEKDKKIWLKASKRIPDGMTVERPREGTYFWWGEDEAWQTSKELVEHADKHGNLRVIIDAIKSNRVQDDFSDLWSYEKEDFERKIYQKRNKIKVSFVEIDNVIPVHCSTSEVHEKLLWEDFFALMNRKEREIIVCLKSGITKMSDIGKHLGYANHSPISKAMSNIRKKAKLMLQ